MGALQLFSYTTWHCPNCKLEHRTDRWLPNRFHQCPRLRGLTAPMLPGERQFRAVAKVEAVVRQDHVGEEIVTYDDGGSIWKRRRPIMSVVTTRDNGQDAAVFAPAARAGAFQQHDLARLLRDLPIHQRLAVLARALAPR